MHHTQTMGRIEKRAPRSITKHVILSLNSLQWIVRTWLHRNLGDIMAFNNAVLLHVILHVLLLLIKLLPVCVCSGEGIPCNPALPGGLRLPRSFLPSGRRGAALCFALMELCEGSSPAFGSWTSNPVGVPTRGCAWGSSSSVLSSARGVLSLPSPRRAHVHGPG